MLMQYLEHILLDACYVWWQFAQRNKVHCSINHVNNMKTRYVMMTINVCLPSTVFIFVFPAIHVLESVMQEHIQHVN